MENKLMKEFIEFEGLSEQLIDNINDDDDKDDDDFNLIERKNASTLNSAEVYHELESRKITPDGFLDKDRLKLQIILDEEYEKNYKEAKKLRNELKKKNIQQTRLLERRMKMENSLQEEQDELSNNIQLAMMIEYIKDNLIGKLENLSINEYDPATNVTNNIMSSGSLRLEINSISARSLAKAMWSNVTITSLDLSANELDDHAGIYIAKILKHNNHLIKLELDNNLLGSRTCAAFGEVLKLNPSLKYLSLDSNPLCSQDNNGMKFLIESLRYNKNLVSLNLWRTGITKPIGVELANAMIENDNLLFCDISHNDIDIMDIKRITDKLDSNLSVYDHNMRILRSDEEKEKQRQLAIQAEIDKKKDEERVAKWLEDERLERRNVRLLQEEERIAKYHADLEEKRRLQELDAEAARKAAEEAAAKKAKKKGKKDKGKKK